MAKLKSSDVAHVAKLSKLDLSNEETNKFQNQLSEVVDYFNQLSEVDTSKVTPTSNTTGLINISRVDKVKPSQSLTQDTAISGTEKTHNGYFVVDAILQNRNE